MNLRWRAIVVRSWPPAATRGFDLRALFRAARAVTTVDPEPKSDRQTQSLRCMNNGSSSLGFEGREEDG